MRIVLFHPVRLPPVDYGGVERVVLWLAKGLIELGHEVWVGALEGSQIPAPIRTLSFASHARSVRDLIGVLPSGTDIVHFHAPPETHEVGGLPCPWLLTVHGNGKTDEAYPENTVFLTHDHAQRHGAEFFIFNGVDPSEYEFAPEKKSHDFVFLSKTSWKVKNVEGAIRLCRRAGVSLRVAGGNRPWLARLRSSWTRGIDWVGPVTGERKARLLARAQGLVFPVRWPEPFGLVMVEAMMSGTPVLGAAWGSVPEVISVQGGRVLPDEFSSDGAGAWKEALRLGFGASDFERAREWALSKFHYIQMAKAYVDAYTRVRSGERLNAQKPVSKGWILP